MSGQHPLTIFSPTLARTNFVFFISLRVATIVRMTLLESPDDGRRMSFDYQSHSLAGVLVCPQAHPKLLRLQKFTFSLQTRGDTIHKFRWPVKRCHTQQNQQIIANSCLISFYEDILIRMSRLSVRCGKEKRIASLSTEHTREMKKRIHFTVHAFVHTNT